MQTALVTRMVRFGAGLLCGLALVAAAQAEAVQLNATQDPAQVSAFTLDFGDGARSADITTTQYTLIADEVAQTTYFASYHQTVDPIILPGGFSTGNIIVEIAQSLPGPYNPVTGVFATQDTYLIYFENDLSMFGLTSPYAMAGHAGGTITYLRGGSGTINSNWQGQGEIPNPVDPAHPNKFSYDCRTNTTFVETPEPGTLALVALGALTGLRRRG